MPPGASKKAKPSRNEENRARTAATSTSAMALSIADRGYVLSTGEIVLEGRAADLLQDEDLKRAYLGR